MTINLSIQDIIIDETTGLQDLDVNTLLAPHSTNLTLQYLLGLLAQREVAFRANFVQATTNAGETITSITLAQDLAGTPFSTTVGVNSGIRTVDGNYVWLFQDATHTNVVIGVIGTSDPLVEPAESGPLAFAFALIGTSAANANLYTVQYVPLLHPDATDADDRIDLTDKVFVSAAGTTVVNFSQLGDAPPGHNNWYILDADAASSQKILVTAHDNGAQAEVNVSTQGLGVASQDVRLGRELQIDLIIGGTQSAGKNFTNAPIAPDYNTHIETVSGAGFSVSQSTPTNTKADIEIHAYNNDDNAEGAALPGDDNDTEINITGVTFKLNGVATTAAALGITVDLTGTGLILHNVGEGVTVDFTTAGGVGGTFDRFTIKNIDTEHDFFDVKEVHFTGQTSNAQSKEVGSFINFDDDGPSIDPSQAAVPTLTVDETTFAIDASASFAGLFTSDFGNDGFKDADNNNVEDADAISYKLGISAPNVASGLVDTLTNEAVTLSVNAAGTVVTGSSATGGTVFTITLNADTGAVTLDQVRAVVHDDPTDPDESSSPAQLSAANLVTLTATITDGDGDTDTATRDIGDAFKFEDDGPSITAPFDADPVAAGVQTPEKLGNAVGQTASGTFGYDIGNDSRPAGYYDATHSDFVDTNGVLAGIQIALTGTVDNTQNPSITQAVVTLTAETDTSASFSFSFHYDKDPITAGVQDGTAGGTLAFNKAADTSTFTLNDAIDGFSFDVLHTADLISKQPTGNTGHPLIVAEQLTANNDPNPFFVQFTANSTTQQIGFGFNSTGDGAPNGPPTDVSFTQGAHDMVTNVNEDWVSATQATNGVAGDTIQKGELLTLRFFQENILSDVNPGAPGGGTERLDPTTSASGVVIKFDGIGASEDLVLILDLKNANGNEITRAVNVENSDLIKGNANVPFPYNTEFTLDNNDALLILEHNDYTVAGETYQIQGIQIMQSANGLTGDAINLNGATGANGGSSATSNLTAWDPTDNDVLKIVDIGFVQQTSGTIDANLDFSFALADADFDPTAMQHLLVNVSNNWIV